MHTDHHIQVGLLFIKKYLMSQGFPWFFLCLFSLPLFSAEPATFKFLVNNFKVEGAIPVSVAKVSEVLLPYQGQGHSLDSLLEVSKKLEKTIHDHGFSFYRVFLPRQPLGKGGTIKLQVVSYKLDFIDIDGNQYFDDQNILNALPGLVIGQSPNTTDLLNELKVATHHPVKNLRLTFKRSKNINRVAATIDVLDDDPENFALVLANTGNDTTGKYRLTGSYQHTNLFNKDHILNVSYTTSPGHIEEVKQYGASYSAPLYQQGAWLTGYLVQSDVDTGTVGVLDISGAGTMMGLHYLKNFPRIGNFEHWLDIGFDNKLFENDILFGSLSLIPDVRSAPLSATYKGEFPWNDYHFNFHVQATMNSGLGSDNNDAAYNGNRLNADDDWAHLRYGLTLHHPFQGWDLSGSISGQYTNETLISGEQFGLGGGASIRGYEERELAKDNGFAIKLEASRPWIKQTRFVGFADYGKGSSHDVQPPRSQTIASLGAGLRWQYKNQVLASIDLAHALKDGATGQTQSGDNKVHATLMVNF